MFAHIRPLGFAALLLGLSLPAGAKSVVDQPGKFKITLPASFKIKSHGRVAAKGDDAKDYVLDAESKTGNIKFFARSTYRRAKKISPSTLFEQWERFVKAKGWYNWLKPLGKAAKVPSVKGSSVIAFSRMYDALAPRKKNVHPFRVIAMVFENPKFNRIYTVTIASHTDYFNKHRQRLLGLMGAFTPISTPPVAGRSKTRPGFKANKGISLRGMLKRKKSGLIIAKKKAMRAQIKKAASKGVSKKVARKVAKADRKGVKVRGRNERKGAKAKVEKTSRKLDKKAASRIKKGKAKAVGSREGREVKKGKNGKVRKSSRHDDGDDEERSTVRKGRNGKKVDKHGRKNGKLDKRAKSRIKKVEKAKKGGKKKVDKKAKGGKKKIEKKKRKSSDDE